MNLGREKISGVFSGSTEVFSPETRTCWNGKTIVVDLVFADEP